MPKDLKLYNPANKERIQELMLKNAMKKEARKAVVRSLMYGLIVLFMWTCDYYKSFLSCLAMIVGAYISVSNGFGACLYFLREFYRKCSSKLKNFKLKSIKNIFSKKKDCPKKPVPEKFTINPTEYLKQRNQYLKQRKEREKILSERKSRKNRQNYKLKAKEKEKIVGKMLAAGAKDFINNEEDLKSYLAEYEKNKGSQVKNDDSKTSKLSFLRGLLQNLVYQPSPCILPATVFKKRENELLKLEPDLQDIIGYTIYQDELKTIIFHIRQWISTTILKPLLDDIEYINGVLEHEGYDIFCIGKSPWHSIYRLIENDLKFVNECIPRLYMVLPYLEICSNQEYLLERLNVLAEGAYLNAYKLDSKMLSDHPLLPNDAAIIFNFFCAFMDGQLEKATAGKTPLTLRGRYFSDKYIIIRNTVKKDEVQLKKGAKCGILCTNPVRPKFSLVIRHKTLQHCGGYNNLFYVLIGFISYLRKHNQGCLEGVELGPLGLNVLWILEPAN